MGLKIMKMNSKSRQKLIPIFLFIYLVGLYLISIKFYVIGSICILSWVAWMLYCTKRNNEETEKLIKFLADKYR